MSVQKRLFHYSENPPPAVWNKIQSALEETPDFTQRLHAYEQIPPAHIWQQVSQTVHKSAAPVLTFRTKLFKYAIAAVVLTVIAAGSLFYVKHEMAAPVAHQPSKNTTYPASNTDPSDTPARNQASTPEKEATDGIVNDDTYIADNQMAQHAIVQFSPSVRIGNHQSPGTSELEIRPEEKNIIDIERANRYMIATSETGKAVRLPKKAYSAYACSDIYTDPACKEKLAFIQSKMAASVATDFTNFMDLLKTLQDN